MAIEKKRVTDHVLIQFAYGGDHQLDDKGNPIPIGKVNGAHYVEKEYLVEDGKVIGETNNPENVQAKPLTLEKATELFGKKNAEILIGAENDRKETEQHRAALMKAADDVTAAQHQVKRHTKMLEGKATELAQAHAEIKQLRAVAEQKATDHEKALKTLAETAQGNIRKLNAAWETEVQKRAEILAKEMIRLAAEARINRRQV